MNGLPHPLFLHLYGLSWRCTPEKWTWSLLSRVNDLLYLFVGACQRHLTHHSVVKEDDAATTHQCIVHKIGGAQYIELILREQESPSRIRRFQLLDIQLSYRHRNRHDSAWNCPFLDLSFLCQLQFLTARLIGGAPAVRLECALAVGRR